jgi:hypothetical protein
MAKGSQREYADHLECSESYVSRLKRQGRLVFDADGLVDFAASDALVAASRDPDKEGVSERWRIEKGSAAADIAAAGATARDESAAAAGVLADAPSKEGEIQSRVADHLPLVDADALDAPDADATRDEPSGRTAEDRVLYRRRLQAQASAAEYDQAMKEIELHERAGSLLRVSDARDRMYAYGRHVRDVWQSLESRMTPHLGSEQLATLRSEIKATLHELDRRVAAESRVKREAGITEPA